MPAHPVMALLSAGIAIGAYGGTRVLEGIASGRQKARVRALHPLRVGTPVATDEDNELHARHYLRISASALALALASPLVPALSTAGVALTIYDTLPLMRRAERSLLRGRVGNDLLSSIVSVASLGLGQAVAAALQVTAFHFGDHATIQSRNLSRSVLQDVVPVPEKLRVRRGHDEIEIGLDALRDGDLVLVATGDTIPVDGQVLQGEISVDQHQLTGEALPKGRSQGESVFAGSLVTEGRAELAVGETGAQTAIAQLGAQLRKSVDYTSRLQLLGEKRSDQIALPLLVGSAVALPFLGPSSATAILFSAPANAIRGTASVATSNHLTAITRSGVLVKDGRALEALAGVDTFLFDKTGTLTSDDLSVAGIYPLGTWSRKQILRRAATAEIGLSHPVAKALIKAATEEADFGAESGGGYSSFRVGFGVVATVEGGEVLVGSRGLIAQAGIALPDAAQGLLDTAEAKGASAILVADDRQLQGIIQIQPRLRAEVSDVIAALRRDGIGRIHVVSGDSEGPTRLTAETLGLDGYHFNVLPTDKAALVRRLQSEGHRVCFVGDGVNDALAMKQAHCSISLHGASSIASDTAQVLLMDPSLSKLPFLLAASRDQQQHLKQILTYWGVYAVVNTYLNVQMRIGILPSAVFYGLSFTASYAHASLPRLKPPPARES